MPYAFGSYPRTNRRVPHTPDFLWSFVGSLNFMRLSLKERRTRGPVQSCVQEIRGISLVFREMWATASRPSSLPRSPPLRTGAPCSHQRTWAENDGRPQISYFALLARATCAALLKESRMKLRNVTTFERESGIRGPKTMGDPRFPTSRCWQGPRVRLSLKRAHEVHQRHGSPQEIWGGSPPQLFVPGPTAPKLHLKSLVFGMFPCRRAACPGNLPPRFTGT